MILIVDDEPLGRETVAALLQPQGYQLRFAASGPEALAQAAASPPDLILLDVMLPGRVGVAGCRHLRADPQLGEVPVILLTALDDRDSRLQGIEAGADDFVSKPFDRVELRARVRTITRLNRYRRLLAERAKVARMIELAPDGVLIVDASGATVLANPAMARMLHARHEDTLLGQPFTAFLAQEQRDACFAALRTVMADPRVVVRREAVFVCLDRGILPVEIHAGYVAWDGQPAAQIIARDITERKQAELLEEERQHIAYELHDGLAQLVTSVHQHLQAFAGHYRPRSAQARQELDRPLELAQRAVKEVRRVIGGLRPTILDDFGLAAALQIHIASLCADGWEISYRETLGEERLPPSIETVIFRVVLEALMNVRKHAQTTQVHLGLERQGQSIHLLIQDWGRGFDPSALPTATGLGERIGLRGMRERITLLGGRWSIQSRPGSGTLIVAEIPLPSGEGGASYEA
jgi:PAS domain S-box-containing protein